MVWKVTRKWSRPGDPLSWRREYDWIRTNSTFDLGMKLRMPVCYHMELLEGENHLWMEHILGVSGNSLTQSMLEETAYQWGAFQGRMIKGLKSSLGENLTDVSFLESELSQWYHNPYDYHYLCSDDCGIPSTIKEVLRRNDWDDGYSIIYHYIRSDDCDLPHHVKQMIIDLDKDREAEFLRFSRLPIVISHRDLWQENIIYREGTIDLIDWDCVGWGYLGEDLASLIADDTPTSHLNAWFESLFSNYIKGFQSNGAASVLEPRDIVVMILIKYGYRLVDEYWFANSKSRKLEIGRRLSVFYGWIHQT